MLKDAPAFSGFSTDNIEAAKAFYGETLGLSVTQQPEGLDIKLGGGGNVFVYPKADHQPATFTVLNFKVADIDAAVTDLTSKGVSFEHYEGLNPDSDVARGKAEGHGPDIAWFKDPAGNILAVMS